MARLRPMARSSVEEMTYEVYPAVRLASGDLTATFCPSLGMIGCSLTHAGAELLGQRGGLKRYAEAGSTMGIPLLHPWANRLARFGYAVGGREVELDPGSPLLHVDGATGLPIHGLLAASRYWNDVTMGASADTAELRARLDFGAHPDLLAACPFPHTLELGAVLDEGGLTIETTVTPTADTAVPISFGFHPYLQLPGAERRDWRISIGAERRFVLDDEMIPTGQTERSDVASGPLGERTFDDGFLDLAGPPQCSLEGGGRRVEVSFLNGYPFAQVYAPPDQDVVCFEPMTAPTSALVSGGPSLRLAAPGEAFGARFRVAVSTS